MRKNFELKKSTSTPPSFNILKEPYFYIITLGIILRFIWIYYMKTYPETDFMWYHIRGIELSEGKGFLNGIYPYYIGQPGVPTAFRPLGYPLTLAFLYKLFGTSLFVGKYFNIFLSFIIMFCIYRISIKFFNKKISLLALALYSFSPLAICYTSILGSETLFSAILILITYIFFEYNSPFILGILVGYLTLIRPIGMFFPIVFLVFLLIKNIKNIKEHLKYILTFSLMTLLIISPWVIRNYFCFGDLIFSTNGGYVFYVNNNPYATGSWSDPFSYPDSPFLKYKTEVGFDEISINKLGKELALNWIKENPSQFTKLAFKRIYNSYWNKLDDIMWSFTIGLNQWNPLYINAIKLETLLYRPFYLITFCYIFYSIYNFLKLRKANIHTFILITFLYFNAMMFILEGNSRYVFPLHPLYCIGVSFIIIKVISKILRKYKRILKKKHFKKEFFR